MKCSVRRQYGALVAGMQVMESYLAEGRAKQPRDQRNRSPTRSVTSQHVSMTSHQASLTSQQSLPVRIGWKSKDNEGLKLPEVESKVGEGVKAKGETEKKVITGDAEEGKEETDKEDLIELRQLSSHHISTSSIPDFIRTRQAINSPEHTPSHTKIRADTTNLRFMKGNKYRMLVRSSSRVIKPPNNVSRPSRFDRNQQDVGRATLPTIVQESELSPEAEAGLLERQRSLVSLVNRSRRCNSVDVTDSRNRTSLASPSFSSASPIKVYPQSPGRHHPKGASLLVIRSPPSSPATARSKSSIAAPGLMINTSSSPPSSSRSPKGQVLLRSPWRHKHEREKKTQSAKALIRKKDREASPGSKTKPNDSNEDNVALKAVSLSNIAPDENMFVKKRGKMDALTTYLRIIPPGFQIPLGALDGVTPKSRLENYVKLGADKRIYLTFCQSVGPEVTPQRMLLQRKPLNNFIEEPKEQSEKTKGVVRFKPIHIP